MFARAPLQSCPLGSVVQQGYAFIWLAGESPYFAKRDGVIVEKEVKGDVIPYIIVGAEGFKPSNKKSR